MLLKIEWIELDYRERIGNVRSVQPMHSRRLRPGSSGQWA